MSLRDRRQKEFAKVWLDNNRHGILNLCPRFGKIYTTINILEKMDKNINILIAYPDVKIKDSWEQDFESRGYKNPNITYTTHLSLHKHTIKRYDMLIVDEIHLLSDAQMDACVEVIDNADSVLGLTGTLSSWTEAELDQRLRLPVIAHYPIEQAIEEGVIVDYQITVLKVPLDNKIILPIKGKERTEKKHFDACSWVIDKLEKEGKNTMMLRLKRMRLIQNSVAKLALTRQLLQKYNQERVLVFCGTTDMADSLGIASHHSKSGDKEAFKRFAEGEGNHMAVVKIGNTGVTYKPLNKVVLNYFDSNAENLAQKVNRCMAMEYNNPDKKADIYIISTDEPVEEKWLNKALEFFDKEKIRVVNVSRNL
jgi:superfamily II DNA or RNA helicase